MAARSLTPALTTGLLVAGGALVGAAVTRLLSRKPAQQHKGVFVLVITLTMESAAAATEFLEAWRPLAEFCRAHEPETLSYEAAVCDSNPTEILIYERYTSRAGLTEIHQKGALFLAFKAHPIHARIMAKQGKSYIESDIGYVTRG
jgi:quinol monooxygenase YgiN